MKNFPEGIDAKERVAYALECLPEPVSHYQNKSRPFLYWTIRDYFEAFTTSRLTPIEVRWFYRSVANLLHFLKSTYLVELLSEPSLL